MKYLFTATVMTGLAAGFAIAPTPSDAETMKKLRHVHASQPAQILPYPGSVFDPSGGNAAAGGNNANSMNGSNSAGENANGRTSGGGHG